MRTIIDAQDAWRDGEAWVPKSPGNADHEAILAGLEDGTIVLVDPPEPEWLPEDFRRAAEAYILARFSVLELMDMQQRLLVSPAAELEAVLQWLDAVKAVAVGGSMDFAAVGEPPFTYLETL